MYILRNEHLLIIYTNKNLTYVQLYCNKNLFPYMFYLILSADKKILLILQYITRRFPATKILPNLIRLKKYRVNFVFHAKCLVINKFRIYISQLLPPARLKIYD